MITTFGKIPGGRIDITLTDVGTVEIQIVPDKISFRVSDVETVGAKVGLPANAEKIAARVLAAAVGDGVPAVSHDINRITMDAMNVLHEAMAAGDFGKRGIGLDLKVTTP